MIEVQSRYFYFEIGDIVFLRVYNEPNRGMVTGIMIRETTSIYMITWGDGNEKFHSHLELSREFEPYYPQSSSLTNESQNNG